MWYQLIAVNLDASGYTVRCFRDMREAQEAFEEARAMWTCESRTDIDFAQPLLVEVQAVVVDGDISAMEWVLTRQPGVRS